MFSVAHAVLWRSLPYAHPERLVTITEVEQKKPDNQWAHRIRTLRIGAHDPTRSKTHGDSPRRRDFENWK